MSSKLIPLKIESDLMYRRYLSQVEKLNFISANLPEDKNYLVSKICLTFVVTRTSVIRELNTFINGGILKYDKKNKTVHSTPLLKEYVSQLEQNMKDYEPTLYRY